MAVLGSEVVLDNIVAFGGQFLKTVNETMKVGGQTVEYRIRRNSSLSDHSLAALRRLGHPYASRHGSKGLQIHDPYYQVHSQGGGLLNALFTKQEDASFDSGRVRAAVAIGFDENRAPHALFVVFGTSKMIPRDVLEGSLREAQPQLEKYFQQTLKNAVVSFRGTGTRGS